MICEAKKVNLKERDLYSTYSNILRLVNREEGEKTWETREMGEGEKESEIRNEREGEDGMRAKNWKEWERRRR